jgi:hypothetical protein
MPVVAFGDVVPVRSGNLITNTVETADLPCRIISNMQSTSQRTKRITAGTGKVLTTEWSIDVVALLRPVGDGLGLSDINDIYAEYLESFLSHMGDIGTARYQPDMTTQRCTVLQWPSGGDRSYAAVISTVTFTDIVYLA